MSFGDLKEAGDGIRLYLWEVGWAVLNSRGNEHKRLKIMKNISRRARTKSQNDWWACVAYKKTAFLIWMSTIIRKEPGSITKKIQKTTELTVLFGWMLTALVRWPARQWYKYMVQIYIIFELKKSWCYGELLSSCTSCVFMIFTMIYMP